MAIETALAKASLTRVDQRDPYKLFHKMRPAQLQALTPAFPGKRYLKRSELGRCSHAQRDRAGIFQRGADAACNRRAG